MALNRARIAVDAMGGDYAPDEIVAGALRAQDELGVEVLLVGDPAAIEASLQRHDRSPEDVQIIASEGAVEMHEEALTGIKRKPNASINVAMSLVKQGEADGVVSAGHSGASMASALLRLGRLSGIDRPAIGAVFPTMNPDRSVLILDVGAIVDCRPKFLEQFALLGTAYSQYVLGRDEPRVGLLNIGEEACKGNELALRTYELLQNHPRIPFVGNAEGRDVLSGDFDVIVCDGFVGNVLLKFAEAVGNILLQLCQDELLQGLDERDLVHVMPNLKRLKQRIDYVEHGGGLLLGVAGVCVIGHGSSHAMTIFNAVRLAKEAVDNRVIERIQEKHLVEQ
ncbi:phosphate acyltransferase PlsX [Sodalinema gerasimenkoae]|uniref:phosphate acyltransferase PlsX n=1 Tax=Sodalinema gerasimenkoae TaxID=2862348 RepID=UPI00135AD6AE|nr:phosphate acyltransferase PlsX [Sodalinema gerasimenkoae]